MSFGRVILECVRVSYYFHPPLSERRHGRAFHNSWAAYLSSRLNALLPVGRRHQPLPTLPLWLRGGLCLPVELEATYTRTCVEQRVQPAA